MVQEMKLSDILTNFRSSKEIPVLEMAAYVKMTNCCGCAAGLKLADNFSAAKLRFHHLYRPRLAAKDGHEEAVTFQLESSPQNASNHDFR